MSSRSSRHNNNNKLAAKKLSSSLSSSGGGGGLNISGASPGLFDEQGWFVMKGTFIGRDALAPCFVRNKRNRCGVGSVGCVLSLSRARTVRARVACAACPVGGLYTLARFFSDVLNNKYSLTNTHTHTQLYRTSQMRHLHLATCLEISRTKRISVNLPPKPTKSQHSLQHRTSHPRLRCRELHRVPKLSRCQAQETARRRRQIRTQTKNQP